MSGLVVCYSVSNHLDHIYQNMCETYNISGMKQLLDLLFNLPDVSLVSKGGTRRFPPGYERLTVLINCLLLKVKSNNGYYK